MTFDGADQPNRTNEPLVGIDPSSLPDLELGGEFLHVDFQTALTDTKLYTDALERLDGVNTDLEFGILDEVPERALAEAEAHMEHSREIMVRYLGDDPEQAIQRMTIFGFYRLTKRIAEDPDVNPRKIMAEGVEFSNISRKFFVTARRRSIKRLGDMHDDLDKVETVAARHAFLQSHSDAPQGEKDRSDHGSRGLLKAVKIFNGATKGTLPGERDFEILRELSTYGGAILITWMLRYVPKKDRIQMGYRLFKSGMNPQVVQDLFNQGEWDIYLRSKKAPESLVVAVKAHKETFRDIARAEDATGSISARVHNTFQALQQTAEAGLTRTLHAAVTSLEQIDAMGETVRDRDQAVALLERRARRVPDEEDKSALEQRINALKDVA